MDVGTVSLSMVEHTYFPSSIKVYTTGLQSIPCVVPVTHGKLTAASGNAAKQNQSLLNTAGEGSITTEQISGHV